MGVCMCTGTATPREALSHCFKAFLSLLHTLLGVLLVNYVFLLSIVWRYSGLIWMQPLLKCYDLKVFKGARSRNFRQFQHWSSGHRINWSNKMTAQNYRRTQTKHRKAKKGQGWTKLGRFEMDCIWVNLKNVGPVYIKMSFKHQENHSQLLCGRDSENERLLLCQIDV